MAQTEQCLDRDIALYRQAAYAKTTKSTYLSQLRCYLAFCNSYGYTPVPVLSLHLYRYVAYLGTRLKPCYYYKYKTDFIYLSLNHPSVKTITSFVYTC